MVERPSRAASPGHPSGAILVVGGGATPPEVYEAFYQLSGGRDSHMIHIPTATARFEDIPDLRDYYSEWYDRPSRSFRFLHTRSRYEAQDANFAEPLRQATGVWIGGGDQNVLLSLYGGTPVVDGLHDVLARGGVIAGTSSGAAVVSDIMVSDETVDTLSIAYGFGLLPGMIVDSHLDTRQRAERMFRLARQFPQITGIGIDERTAILIRHGRLEVLGRGRVSFFLPAQQGQVVCFRIGAGEVCALPSAMEPALADLTSAKRRAPRETR
jgi:cyanophycinase